MHCQLLFRSSPSFVHIVSQRSWNSCQSRVEHALKMSFPSRHWYLSAHNMTEWRKSFCLHVTCLSSIYVGYVSWLYLVMRRVKLQNIYRPRPTLWIKFVAQIMWFHINIFPNVSEISLPSPGKINLIYYSDIKNNNKQCFRIDLFKSKS